MEAGAGHNESKENHVHVDINKRGTNQPSSIAKEASELKERKKHTRN